MNYRFMLTLFFVAIVTVPCNAQKIESFKPGQQWYDDKGEVINAHGGGILLYDKTYYWFGEARDRHASHGVNVYSSKDLYNWKNEGLALKQETDASSEIAEGSIIERPKVIYNEKTRQFVMWFHLELKGQGYKAACAGVAVSSKPTGPFNFLKSFRPNDNMSRDMTLFKDDDGNAYEIYSSRENYDLRIVKLMHDFLSPSNKDSLLFSKHREAPAIFKYQNKYYLVTSAATGWQPNMADLHAADSLFGRWGSAGNPMEGNNADITFGGQSAYIFPITGKKHSYIFMADKWNPEDLNDSRYIWLPVQFKNGKPYVKWLDEWNLGFFDNK